MKKHIIGKVLAALIVLAASSYFINLQAQDVVVEFTNPDGKSYGSSNEGFLGVGIGGSGSGATADGKAFAVDDPHVELLFKIGVAGQIELEAKTPTTYEPCVFAVTSWNSTNVGSTTITELFGKSFSLILTGESRMQLGQDVDGNRGGIGVRGRNQYRLDDEGSEWLKFTLDGKVGIEFVNIGYIDVSGGDDANFILKDFDTDQYHVLIDGVDGTPHPPSLKIPATDYSMRYNTDELTVTTADTVGNGGGKLYSLEFNLVLAEPKPPAISSIKPKRSDSLSFEVTDDIEIQFDNTMDQTKTSAAVTMIPALTSRVDTWTTENDADLLTITHDSLDFETWYTLVVSDAAEAANGLTMLAPDTIRFKTLPPKPEIVSTFPENNATDVLPNTTMSIEFSKSMIRDSVNKGIVFDPAISGITFVWSNDNKTVFISGDEMNVSEMYFITVGPPAMDDFNQLLHKSYTGIFTTAIATSVENDMASGVVIYPNPASGMFQVSGMDVASLQIYSLTGQMLKEIQNSTSIDVSDMETGMYVVSVSDREGNKVRKTVVIK
ncbi:MAG TPA: T9SS type A sorting domain-containing protein [Bacteroides sp.]|nr:T9SS type A sorting domain-containing protein [Bacteroides sp.]